MAALSASPFPTRELYVTLAGRSAPKEGWKLTLYMILMICTTLLSLLFPLKIGCKRYCYELNTLVSF